MGFPEEKQMTPESGRFVMGTVHTEIYGTARAGSLHREIDNFFDFASDAVRIQRFDEIAFHTVLSRGKY